MHFQNGEIKMSINNSLLELETVRKRFEQLDGERQDLSDLIKKLKQIRDTMTTLQKDMDTKKSETEKWLRGLEKSPNSYQHVRQRPIDNSLLPYKHFTKMLKTC